MATITSLESTTTYDSNSAQYRLQKLIVEHLKYKQEHFRHTNTLIAQLHQIQRLLEANKPKEALLSIEQLVCYGETLTRQL